MIKLCDLLLPRIVDVEHDVLGTDARGMDPVDLQEALRGPSVRVIQILVWYRVSIYMALVPQPK